MATRAWGLASNFAAGQVAARAADPGGLARALTRQGFGACAVSEPKLLPEDPAAAAGGGAGGNQGGGAGGSAAALEMSLEPVWDDAWAASLPGLIEPKTGIALDPFLVPPPFSSFGPASSAEEAESKKARAARAKREKAEAKAKKDADKAKAKQAKDRAKVGGAAALSAGVPPGRFPTGAPPLTLVGCGMRAVRALKVSLKVYAVGLYVAPLEAASKANGAAAAASGPRGSQTRGGPSPFALPPGERLVEALLAHPPTEQAPSTALGAYSAFAHSAAGAGSGREREGRIASAGRRAREVGGDGVPFALHLVFSRGVPAKRVAKAIADRLREHGADEGEGSGGPAVDSEVWSA